MALGSSVPSSSTRLRRPSTAPSSLQARRQASVPFLRLETTKADGPAPISPRRVGKMRRPSLPSPSKADVDVPVATPRKRATMVRLPAFTTALQVPLMRSTAAAGMTPFDETPTASLLHFGVSGYGFPPTASPSPQSLFDATTDEFPFDERSTVLRGRDDSVRVSSPPLGCLKVELVEVTPPRKRTGERLYCLLPFPLSLLRQRQTAIMTTSPTGALHLHMPRRSGRSQRTHHAMEALEDALNAGVEVEPLVGAGTWEMDLPAFVAVCRTVSSRRTKRGRTMWTIIEWVKPWRRDVLQRLEGEGWERVY